METRDGTFVLLLILGAIGPALPLSQGHSAAPAAVAAPTRGRIRPLLHNRERLIVTRGRRGRITEISVERDATLGDG